MYIRTLITVGAIGALAYQSREKLPKVFEEANELRLGYPFFKIFMKKAREETQAFTSKVNDHAKRAWWAYVHPEILGQSSVGANTLALDPFGDGSLGEGIWTWAKAPNIVLTPIIKDGLLNKEEAVQQEAVPMGKILATL